MDVYRIHTQARARPNLRRAHDLLGQDLGEDEEGQRARADGKEHHVGQDACQRGGALQGLGGCRAGRAIAPSVGSWEGNAPLGFPAPTPTNLRPLWSEASARIVPQAYSERGWGSGGLRSGAGRPALAHLAAA